MKKNNRSEQYATEDTELLLLKEVPFFNDAKNKFIAKILKKNKIKSLLDLGCGTGKLTITLAKMGFDVHGIDISPRLIKVAKKTAKKEKLNINFVVGDIRRLNLKKKFDCIVLSEVLEHIKDDASLLKSTKKLLKKNGKLFVSVPAFQLLWNQRDKTLGHYRRYNKNSLSKKLKKAGYKVMMIKWYKLIMLPGALLTKLLKRKEYPYDLINPKIKKLLKFWFYHIENKVPLPIGETIMVVAKQKRESH